MFRGISKTKKWPAPVKGAVSFIVVAYLGVLALAVAAGSQQTDMASRPLEARVSALEAQVASLRKGAKAPASSSSDRRTSLYTSGGERVLPLSADGDREKGRWFHMVTDTVRMSSGVAFVTLSSAPSQGSLADVSFRSRASYFGSASPRDTSLLTSNQYTIIPLTGESFRVISSSPSDSSLVTYWVRGE